MNYTEIIDVNKEFQASVNLEFDLNKVDKIRGYIPTEQSVNVLSFFLKSFYYNNYSQERATVLIGPYGRGKSHLLLVLSALTSLDVQLDNSDESKHIQYELCDKISRVDNETGALAKAIVDSEIRTLPVIINSNSTDINQSFLVAINDALSKAGLDYLLPSTYFDSALSLISKWEESFPDALQKLSDELRQKKVTIEELKIELRQFNQNAYRLFCNCYPNIAAGTEFNPLTNMDVIKLYIAVANALVEQTKYKGISIIFDEFSKFLESNLDKSKMHNFKIIQDMAEAATRSKDAQIHFTCVTHKDILDYSSSDSFKTVEGRFNKLRFVASSEQSYELIANAIIKKPSFNEFVIKNQEDFKRVADCSARTDVFNDLTPNAFETKVVKGCFPLAPLSAFALLHVSELVGQNERTLFTFLAQNGEGTLKSFLQSDVTQLRWITIDNVYDYFEELFKKEVFNSAVHSVWAKTNAALRQVKDKNQVLILKAISIINIIGDERIKPVPAHIKATLLITDSEFERSVNGLLKNHILSQRDSSEYVLLTANGVDVQKSVEQYVKTSLPKINICDVLTKACNPGFVIPRSYNDRYSMLRCFKKIFLEANVFAAYKNANQILSDYPYDGLIVYIVCKDLEQRERAIKKLQTFSNNRQIVLCISEHAFDSDELLKQFEAACRLHEKAEDKHFIEELEVFIEDLRRRIIGCMSAMYSPSSEFSSFVTGDGKIEITKQVELNRAISNICMECYNMTPVINNEMVNKNILNSQNSKARDLVVTWILQHSEDNYIPCMEGSGPEVSVFKSAIKHTGLAVSSTVSDPGMNAVLLMIGDFIRDSEKAKKNFQALYHVLLAPPYGIRRGIIPLLIAYAIRPYKENIVLYFKGKEIELSANVLGTLNENPENFDVLVETGTLEKNNYLDSLQKVFFKYVDVKSPSINRVYSVVKSMQNWIRSLPEYSKKYRVYLENGEPKNVSNAIISVRNELMKFEINSRELLFDTWPMIFGFEEKFGECLKTFEQVKLELDSHLLNYKAELTKKLTAMFIPGYQGGLSRAMMSWYDQLTVGQKTHVFDSNSNALLSIAGSVSSYDDASLLQSLVSTYTAIEIEDWNDNLAEIFIKEITESLKKINDYCDTGIEKEDNGHLVIALNGTNVEKNFSIDTISPLGKTALNNLQAVFEEYNGALEPDEQLAILAKLISDLFK